MREEFPDAIILKPSEMFGREDRFFNHYASTCIPNEKKIINKGKGRSFEERELQYMLHCAVT